MSEIPQAAVEAASTALFGIAFVDTREEWDERVLAAVQAALDEMGIRTQEYTPIPGSTVQPRRRFISDWLPVSDPTGEDS